MKASRNGCNIDRNTHIVVNGTRYTLTRADGIQIAPEKTYFSYAGQEIIFTLYFPLSIIESNYGYTKGKIIFD